MAENPTANISYAEYSLAVDNAVRKGAEQINILGGEPLLHPELDMLCYYNADKGLKTTIYTNGILLHKYQPQHFYGAKLRVSFDSLMTTNKAITQLVDNSKNGKSLIHLIDANYMVTTRTTALEMFMAATVLEAWGCKVFFIFNMCEMRNPHQEFFDSSASDLVLPVLEYKAMIHEFMNLYDGKMEIHVSKRGVFESTKSLPHCKCKFSNYFIGGKIIQCPYDIVNLKWQNDYEFDSRFCQQNNTCLMSKLKFQNKRN
jgi:molybdenum cofactor biosynthesis enzyme MoaA